MLSAVAYVPLSGRRAVCSQLERIKAERGPYWSPKRWFQSSVVQPRCLLTQREPGSHISPWASLAAAHGKWPPGYWGPGSPLVDQATFHRWRGCRLTSAGAAHP